MKNILKSIGIFFLIIFILVIVFYFVLLFTANSPSEDNWFNKNFREKFAQNKTTRFLFNLHKQGDAKADYLINDKYKKLVIEIDEGSSCEISNNALKNIKFKINNVLDKTDGVEIIKGDVIETANLTYNQKEIEKLVKEHKNYKANDTSAVLYILCLNRFTDNQENLGVTVNENSIVIFWMALEDRKSIDKEKFDRLVESAILYQFARQLGLEITDKPNCLMPSAQKAENNVKITSEEIVSDFCPEELVEIENIRNRLK